MNDLDRAINTLKKEYERALTLSFVRKPIAFALYATWKKFDNRKERVKDDHDA